VITGVSGREKKRTEERLRACGALGPNEEISGAVEAVRSLSTTPWKGYGRCSKKASAKTGLFRCVRKGCRKSSPTSEEGSGRIGRPE
jgi:hypothetical protein